MESIDPPTPSRFIQELIRQSPREIVNFIVGQKCEELDDVDFIEAIKKGCSLFRWADGETALARNK